MKLQPYQEYLEQTIIPLRLACATESGLLARALALVSLPRRIALLRYPSWR